MELDDEDPDGTLALGAPRVRQLRGLDYLGVCTLAAHENHLGKTWSHPQRFGLNWWLILTSARTENHWTDYYVFLLQHFGIRHRDPLRLVGENGGYSGVTMVLVGEGGLNLLHNLYVCPFPSHPNKPSTQIKQCASLLMELQDQSPSSPLASRQLPKPIV